MFNDGGKCRLEEITGAPVTLFAYPNGKPGRDYGPRDVEFVRERRASPLPYRPRPGLRAAAATFFSCPVSARGSVIRAASAWASSQVTRARPRHECCYIPCPDAIFELDPVPISSLKEWPKYWRRLVRYGRRDFEFQLIGPRLKRYGVAGLPADIQELYSEAHTLKPAWKGIYTLTHLIALHEMRKIGRSRLIATGAAC